MQLVTCLSSFGYMGAAKALMEFLNVAVGPARLPNTSLSPDLRESLRRELERIGFFDWGRRLTGEDFSGLTLSLTEQGARRIL